jgi:murein DD-endopeptidase MepM/ murein hydrolase activator NlpD
MLFPTLADAKYAKVLLDREAEGWIEAYERKHGRGPRSPLLGPALCQQFVGELHGRLGVVWSYGGYLENRSHLWRGSYLEQSGAFIHLGVDFNVPQGTPFVTQCPAAVILVDDDGDLDGGWGQRIFLKPDLPAEREELPAVVLIYAHLQSIAVQPGSRIPAGTVLAEVGGPPHNGNWAPHLHIQALRYDAFARILTEDFDNLDGYGHPDNLAELAELFPDPLGLIRLD